MADLPNAEWGAYSALTPALSPRRGGAARGHRGSPNAEGGAARGHHEEPKLMDPERAMEWKNVRLCSLMFAYVRLMREKCSRRRMVNAVRSCKMHDKRRWGLVEL